MTKMLEPMINEIQQEAAITKRVLERVPADKLSWKPHPKSMSLGQLALHVASIPGNLSRLAQRDGLDTAGRQFRSSASRRREGNSHHSRCQHQSCRRICRHGQRSPPPWETWRLTSKGKEVLAIPRVALLRTIMLNHWYHHRGQLSVYLRMLDVPVPVNLRPQRRRKSICVIDPCPLRLVQRGIHVRVAWAGRD